MVIVALSPGRRLRIAPARSLAVDGQTIAVEAGPAEALGAVVLEVADVGAALDRAVDRGLRVEGDDSVHIAGVHLRLRAAG